MRQTAADLRLAPIAPIAIARLDTPQACNWREGLRLGVTRRRWPIAANFTHFSLTTAKDRNPAEGTPTDPNFAGIAAQ
jgi:hypothetical protein